MLLALVLGAALIVGVFAADALACPQADNSKLHLTVALAGVPKGKTPAKAQLKWKLVGGRAATYFVYSMKGESGTGKRTLRLKTTKSSGIVSVPAKQYTSFVVKSVGPKRITSKPQSVYSPAELKVTGFNAKATSGIDAFVMLSWTSTTGGGIQVRTKDRTGKILGTDEDYFETSIRAPGTQQYGQTYVYEARCRYGSFSSSWVTAPHPPATPYPALPSSAYLQSPEEGLGVNQYIDSFLLYSGAELHRYVYGDPTKDKVIAVSKSATFPIVDADGITPGMEVRYTVRGYTSPGVYGPSANCSDGYDETGAEHWMMIPNPSASLTAVQDGSDVHLTWSGAPSGSVVVIERMVDGGDWSPLTTLSPSSPTYVDAAPPGTYLDYRVTFRGASGAISDSYGASVELQ